MSTIAWFRLLVRAIGVLLIGLSLPSLASALWWIVLSLSDDAYSGYQFAMYGGTSMIAYGLQTGFGAYLLFGGGWIIRHCLREVSGLCANCGYDLAGNTTGVCPECGSVYRPSGPAPSADGPVD